MGSGIFPGSRLAAARFADSISPMAGRVPGNIRPATMLAVWTRTGVSLRSGTECGPAAPSASNGDGKREQS